jgi:hypothetical protein
MSLLADRVGAVNLVIQEYANLPLPSTVDVSRGEYGVGVRFQLDTLDQLIDWAMRFGVLVSFAEKASYVHVAAEITIFDVTMSLWTHLTHRDAFEVLRRWGYKLDRDDISVPAAHALAMNRQAIAS